MFLFGRSSKSPSELVKGLKELFLQLERGEKKYEKVILFKILILDFILLNNFKSG